MRLHQTVILVNLAFGLGLLSGYLWWERDLGQLRRELAAARLANPPRPPVGQTWTVRAIVRGTLPSENMLVITHEPLAEAMGAMTMGFRIGDRVRLDGLEPGDLVQVTVVATEKDFLVVDLRKESGR